MGTRYGACWRTRDLTHPYPNPYPYCITAINTGTDVLFLNSTFKNPLACSADTNRWPHHNRSISNAKPRVTRTAARDFKCVDVVCCNLWSLCSWFWPCFVLTGINDSNYFGEPQTIENTQIKKAAAHFVGTFIRTGIYRTEILKEQIHFIIWKIIHITLFCLFCSFFLYSLFLPEQVIVRDMFQLLVSHCINDTTFLVLNR